MDKVKKIVLGVILFTAVAACGLYSSNFTHTASAANAAPSFTVTNMRDKSVSLASLKGKPVFVNFWATWCPPCVKEMPDIQKMYEKYGDKIQFVTINIDANKKEIKAFMDKHGFTMPVMMDSDGSASAAYSLQAIPVSYIIDSEGNLLNQHLGAMNYSELENFITSAF